MHNDELTKIAEAAGVMTTPAPEPQPDPKPDLAGRALTTMFATIIGLSPTITLYQGGWL